MIPDLFVDLFCKLEKQKKIFKGYLKETLFHNSSFQFPFFQYLIINIHEQISIALSNIYNILYFIDKMYLL